MTDKMMPQHVRDRIRHVIFVVVGFIVILGLFGLGLLIPRVLSAAHADWTNVAGEWDQYRLNETQMNWFKSVRSKQGILCCNIADGHPTAMDHRVDGYYIPNPLNPSGEWLKVPPEALTIPATNPVGVATVWYVQNGVESIHIRCFVPEAET